MRDNDFKQGMRKSKEGFHFLYEKIHHHRVFSNNSTAVQLPISHQLAVTLERLGSNGNAGSVGKLSHNYNIGWGTVIKVSQSVIKAMIHLPSTYVKWPDPNRRHQISAVMQH
ncbi:hypothetical protein O181_108466 [Austropuccinia psidii MF-1]|uniref:Uncharacterized protein n=1 Tax=Austropuccinia psidii MF-1 TaxID=1389203 RepID=A0A9Q3JVC8_9BASI|nr:hypothetical protein [Austropuccinia psidii MF-1]